MALQNYLKLILRKHFYFKIIEVNPEWPDNGGEISQQMRFGGLIKTTFL